MNRIRVSKRAHPNADGLRRDRRKLPNKQASDREEEFRIVSDGSAEDSRKTRQRSVQSKAVPLFDAQDAQMQTLSAYVTEAAGPHFPRQS